MALRESEFQGKPCILAFFDDEFEACEEDDATLVKVIFEDGSNLFTAPEGLTEGEGVEAEHKEEPPPPEEEEGLG